MAREHDDIDRIAPSRIPPGVWVLGGVSLLMDISSEMIHSLLPLFMVTTLGLGAFTVGVIEGLAESTALIVKIFSGALSDYLGKRKALALLGYALGAARRAGRGHHASRGARGGVRAAPVARHRGGLHRPAARDRTDAVVGG